MQTITREQPNIHPLFTQFDNLYKELSEHTNKSKLLPTWYSKAFDPLIELFKKYGYEGNINTCWQSLSSITIAKPSKNVIVCFSGGKDSIAVVKRCLQLGKNVYLYHMRHINPPLHDEWIQAQKLADYWGIPIYIDTVKLSGNHCYVEHPMKNYMIANGALQWGLKGHITTNIVFGNYKTSSLEFDNFEFCGGDDREMWDIYDKIISTIIPAFSIGIILGNLSDTLDTVCSDKELLDMSVSCLCRASLRQHWHDWVKDKFGIELPKYRCGRCYKCCIEYIYMVDHDLQKYSPEYYQYCFNNLKKNVEREDGCKYTDEQVWNHYFFYPIEKSKCYG